MRGIRAAFRLLDSTEQFLSLHYVAVPAQPWAALEQAWLGRLPAWRRERIAALRTAADRNASILGHVLLGFGCDRLGWPFVPAALVAGPGGRPELPGGPWFSITHSPGLVACVCAATGPLGLDLEQDGATSGRHLRLALGAAEQARIAAGDLDPTAAWVAAEAVVKAAGLGIAATPRVRLLDGRATLDGIEFGVTPVSVAAGYVARIAHGPGPVRVEVQCHDASSVAPLP